MTPSIQPDKGVSQSTTEYYVAQGDKGRFDIAMRDSETKEIVIVDSGIRSFDAAVKRRQSWERKEQQARTKAARRTA